MTATWLRIRVELIGGGKQPALWPRPGRVIVASPDMSFRDLAAAIDVAFARWDLTHRQRFTLADGSHLRPPASAEAASAGAASGADQDDATAPLSRLSPGEQFAYEFDLGARWQHLCTVGLALLDPEAELDREPAGPVTIAGWGTIPDQYGRTWGDPAVATIDDGGSGRPGDHDDIELPAGLAVRSWADDWAAEWADELPEGWMDLWADRAGSPPAAPVPPLSDLPPILPSWGPGSASGADSDPSPTGAPHGGADLAAEAPVAAAGLRTWNPEAASELSRAVAAEHDGTVLRLLARYDALLVTQRCAESLARMAAAGGPDEDVLVRGVVERLDGRGWPGDAELADLLHDLVHVRLSAAGMEDTWGRAHRIVEDDDSPRRPTPVDLATLGAILGGDVDHTHPWVLEVATGRLLAPAEDLPDFPDGVRVVGLGPPPLIEDVRVIAEALGTPVDEDETPSAHLMLVERQLGRVRWWLTEVGLRPA